MIIQFKTVHIQFTNLKKGQCHKNSKEFFIRCCFHSSGYNHWYRSRTYLTLPAPVPDKFKFRLLQYFFFLSLLPHLPPPPPPPNMPMPYWFYCNWAGLSSRGTAGRQANTAAPSAAVSANHKPVTTCPYFVSALYCGSVRAFETDEPKQFAFWYGKMVFV